MERATKEEVRRRLGIKGFKLSKQAFNDMLRNVVYVGDILVTAWKKEEATRVKGLHPPIASRGDLSKGESCAFK